MRENVDLTALCGGQVNFLQNIVKFREPVGRFISAFRILAESRKECLLVLHPLKGRIGNQKTVRTDQDQGRDLQPFQQIHILICQFLYIQLTVKPFLDQQLDPFTASDERITDHVRKFIGAETCPDETAVTIAGIHREEYRRAVAKGQIREQGRLLQGRDLQYTLCPHDPIKAGIHTFNGVIRPSDTVQPKVFRFRPSRITIQDHPDRDRIQKADRIQDGPDITFNIGPHNYSIRSRIF